MRNLHLLRNINLKVPQFCETNKYFVVNVNDCGDSKSTTIQCFVFSHDLQVYQLNIRNNYAEDLHFIAKLTEDIKKSADTKIVECNYLFNQLLVILNDGRIFVILLEEGEVKSSDLNISVKYVSWSPDINRTAIINDEDELYVYNIPFDSVKVLSKVSLHGESEEQNKFVDVGWGNIATQFRGSEGKYSKLKPEEPVRDIPHDSNINICWKQNSTAFAVSYLSRMENLRQVKIFNQDGVLLNTTKNVDGLLSPIDWCSSRNLISAVQKLPNKQVVCFLEQNAMKHGDFQLADDLQVITLRWNSSGNILACHGKSQGVELLTLWTTSNYKWYQKQQLVFPTRVTYLQWDLDTPNRLHVILETGIYRMYEWTLRIDESSRYGGNSDPCLVGVINNKHLNLTPFRQVCQPASMPHETFSCSAAINAVIFASDCQSREKLDHKPILLYLSNNRCALTSYGSTSENIYCFNFGNSNSEIEFETPSELSVWLWLSPNELYFNWSRTDGNYFCVAQIDSQSKSIVLKNIIKLESLITAIANYELDVIVHSEDGALYVYRNNQLCKMEFSLLEACVQVQALNAEKLIALSGHRNLYINERIMWRDVMSFYWTAPFLVVIRMGNQLFITKVDFTDGRVEFNEVQIRSIEPKSHLVTIVDDQLILEMERGNLEMIRPRPFSIFKMEQMLSEGKYLEVFRMLRKQRINLNILFDHDPNMFMKNVDSIVENICDAMYLSMFVTELVEENVAKSMFPWKYGEIDDFKDKVSVICEALVASIRKHGVKEMINAFIAALVKQGKLAEAAKYAVEYNEISSLCQLADPISVYKATLASYDIACSLRIVERSKLDPSEYLPLIRALQTMEENYRKFKICDYLEKYDEALVHLAKCSEKFEECVKYIEKHGLYSSAIDVFSEETESIEFENSRYRKVLVIAADFYFENRLYEEAGILYEKANVNKKAFECYTIEGDWFSAISTLMLMDKKMLEREAYEMLYKTLLKQRQYVNAAFIAFNHLKDYRKAVESFLSAKEYCSALNAAKGLKDKNAKQELFHPFLRNEVKNILENLNNYVETIENHAERLYHLREKKKNKENDVLDDGESSVYSIASSATTDSTGSVSSFNSGTSVSSSAKRARRRERKLWNIKKGNPREEQSLLATLKDKFTDIDKSYPKMVEDLSKALVKVDEIKLARELKLKYSEFVKFLQTTCDRIWCVDELVEEGGFKDISIRYPPTISDVSTKMKFL